MAFLDIDGRSVAYRDTGSQTAPLVILAHPLGMTQAVWDDIVPVLAGRYRVITWDLPGHGASAPCVGEVRPEQLAAEALALADHAGAQRFHFAGTSIGGVIGQQLLIQAPERLDRVVLTNTGAVIGTPDNWHTRARRVREEGVAALVDEIVPRWFSQASRSAAPALEAGWKTVLARTDDESYARLCELLATTDYRGKLRSTHIGVCLLGGSEDLATPPETLQALDAELADSELEILDGVAHVPSLDCPDIINQRLTAWLAGDDQGAGEQGVGYAEGLQTRKQVLGDAHVARASANATTLDAPFQGMITRLAWGELWGNDDLTRPERSMITIAVLAALGRDGELELHLKTAKRIGLSEAQLRQALMHVAIYAGVPAANHAFSMAKKLGWGAALG